MAAAVAEQPNGLGSSQKTVNNTFRTSGRPTQYRGMDNGWNTALLYIGYGITGRRIVCQRKLWPHKRYELVACGLKYTLGRPLSQNVLFCFH